VALADVGPLARLIDPGLKDPEARNRERIAALLELVALPVDDEAIEALCAGDKQLADWLRATCHDEAVKDLIAASDKLRRYVQARAREAEGELKTAEGRATAAMEDANAQSREVSERWQKPIPAEALLSEADALARVQEATRQHERTLASAQQREALEQQQEGIRRTCGPRPDPTEAEERLRSIQLTVAASERRIAEMQAELMAAEANLKADKVRLENAQEHRDQTDTDARYWDKQRAILAVAPAGATQAKVDADAEILANTQLDVERHRASRALYDALDRQKTADAEASTAREEAARLRETAASVHQRLAGLLERHGSRLTVADGRLVLLDAGGEARDFDLRLSDGQRVAAALEIAAGAYPAGVVALDGRYWLALDPENRTAFAAAAAERGLYVVTEQPDAGELRVERS